MVLRNWHVPALAFAVVDCNHVHNIPDPVVVVVVPAVQHCHPSPIHALPLVFFHYLYHFGSFHGHCAEYQTFDR
jgi:hypothetical protein